MSAHLSREIENLKDEILMVGAMAEQSVRKATLAIKRQDQALARSVIEKDIKIDQVEIEVEESCLKVLALHHPVDADLRFIIAVLKIDSDLEHVGNLAVNMVEHIFCPATQPNVEVDSDFTGMAIKTLYMLKMSLGALVNLDAKVARKVCAWDARADATYRQMRGAVQKAVSRSPEQAESLMNLLSASQYLECVAHCATRMAEDIIYMIEGDIIRQKAEGLITCLYC